MSGIALTEGVILNLTGKKTPQLSQMKELDVSGSKIKRVDPGAFKKLVNLRSLKLSNNQIRSLSFESDLSHLQRLDIKENCISSLEFLHQLPNLEEIIFECNGLEAWHSYFAVLLCPKLAKLNNVPTTKLRLAVEGCREACWNLMESVWTEEFFDSDLTESNRSSKANEFLHRVRAKKSSGLSVPVQFKDFLLNLSKAMSSFQMKKLCEEFFDQLEAKKLASKTTEDEETTEMDEEEVDVEEIFVPLHDYDPTHFLRCHFNDRKALKNGHHDDDPTDELTNVWSCAMEPNPQNSAETTGIIATCGGDCVCLIDCSTGLVMKRFRQVRESPDIFENLYFGQMAIVQFYCLAWTTLTLECDGIQRKSNILAVSGHNGLLKLLHPGQLVCYAEHGSGRPNKTIQDFYYSCLMFHPQQKTWLFCGSSDTTITLFDIGTPTGEQYTSEIKQMLILNTKPAALLVNMVFHESTNHLVAGTGKGCFAWPIDEGKIKTKGSSKRCEPSLELQLPSGQKMVDGLVLLNTDYVACKCVASGCIFIFSLTKALKHMNIQISQLEWCQTNTDFIGIGSRNGILACGDDQGRIWLYNLQTWLESKSKTESEIFLPSRILPWPSCQLGPRTEDQRMTDVLDKPEPLVVNAVTITSDHNYIVGVTDCNLVCVWKKTTEKATQK